MERREIFRILGGGLAVTDVAAAQHHAPGAPAAVVPANYQPRFLTAEEYRTVTELADMILPADERSQGAGQAGAAWYIDTLLHFASDGARSMWKPGLSPFLGQTAAQRLQNLSGLAAHEDRPQTPEQQFFVLLKRTVVEFYFLSDAGRQAIGYRGDSAIREFRGCNHPRHWT